MDEQHLTTVNQVVGFKIKSENQENNQNQPNSSQGQTNKPLKTDVPAKRSSSKVTSSDAVPCRAYAMAEYYRQRKELQMKKIKVEEDKQRIHKARPMPNFRAIHSKAMTTLNSNEPCLSPQTPQVLRRGLEMKQKQKQKIEEFQKKLAERPPIVTRSTKVLTDEPFVPKIEPHPQLKVVPFNLKMSERLLHRKEYDENYQRQLAKKKEQEDELKREKENRTRQAVREMTTFKARPNPFKKPEETS